MRHSNMLLIRAATHNYFHYRLICRRFKDIQLTLFNTIEIQESFHLESSDGLEK